MATRAFTIRADSGIEVQFATAPVECSDLKSGYALMERDVPLRVTLAQTGNSGASSRCWSNVRIRLKDDESRASRARVARGSRDSLRADGSVSLAPSCRRPRHLCGNRLRQRGSARCSHSLVEASVSRRIRDVYPYDEEMIDVRQPTAESQQLRLRRGRGTSYTQSPLRRAVVAGGALQRRLAHQRQSRAVTPVRCMQNL